MEFSNIEPAYLFISQVKAAFRVEDVDLAAHQQPYTVHLCSAVAELPQGQAPHHLAAALRYPPSAVRAHQRCLSYGTY